ncbi:MAG: class I SAM-dependent methyltransferase, partial [Chloroflexi bacterium]|nr:class I SAM-dependent methyltransferase [Chloroflexota bacterium]
GGRLQFYAALYEDFLAFPKYLREGGAWPRSEHQPWLLETIGNMTKPDAVNIVDRVVPQAEAVMGRLDASGGAILDIGAGGGFAVLQYARRFPKAQVLGIETEPGMVALARRAIAEEGLDNADVQVADANEMTEYAAYDLVTMNVALHETGGPAEWRNVLARVLTALKPGGVVVVSELPIPTHRRPTARIQSTRR